MQAKQPENRLDKMFSFLHLKGFCSNNPVVSVLYLKGVIGKCLSSKSGLTIEALNDDIEKAFKDKRLAAVCIIVNSPGGTPVQAELIANKIMQLSELKNIPVYCFIEDVAASGGYWLACAAQEIYASKSSIIGSIGVISQGFGLDKFIKRFDIERRVHCSGKNKSILDPFQPQKKEDVDLILDAQKSIHKNFIDYVKDRRKDKLIQDDDLLFNGKFWTGDTALKHGLIDGIDDVYNFIKNKFGDDVKIKHIKQGKSFFKKILGVEKFIDVFFNKLEEKIIYNKFDLY